MFHPWQGSAPVGATFESSCSIESSTFVAMLPMTGILANATTRPKKQNSCSAAWELSQYGTNLLRRPWQLKQHPSLPSLRRAGPTISPKSLQIIIAFRLQALRVAACHQLLVSDTRVCVDDLTRRRVKWLARRGLDVSTCLHVSASTFRPTRSSTEPL